MERTFCIIKPDAVARNLQGEILAMIQGAGLRVVAMKQIRMTRQQAEGFYAVHKERPFFASLTEYMSSGPVVCAILEGDKAISRYRELMGATNPANAYGTAFWAGLTGEITAADPFRLAWSVNYGTFDSGEEALNRSGWYASLLAEYKLDWGTPGIYAWYSSGDDDDPTNGSERLPSFD